MTQHWYDRPIFSWTELRSLLLARKAHGVTGKALTAELVRDAGGELISRDSFGPAVVEYPTSSGPWHFNYAAEEIDKIPARCKAIPEYVKLDPRFDEDVDAAGYFQKIAATQRIEPLSDAERQALLGEADVREATPEDILG